MAGQNTLTFTDATFDRTCFGRTSRFWWIFGPNGAARAGRWRPRSMSWRANMPEK